MYLVHIYNIYILQSDILIVNIYCTILTNSKKSKVSTWEVVTYYFSSLIVQDRRLKSEEFCFENKIQNEAIVFSSFLAKIIIIPITKIGSKWYLIVLPHINIDLDGYLLLI